MKKLLVFVFAAVIAVAFAATGFAQAPAPEKTEAPAATEKAPAKAKKAKKPKKAKKAKKPMTEEKKMEEAPAPAK
jgi:flagellar basal body L-ring protein FlgH